MLFVLALVSLASVWVDGTPVSSTDGERAAQAFLHSEVSRSPAYRAAVGVSEGVRIRKETEFRDPESGDLLGYVFALDPSGYLVMPAETRLVPVIAYSYAGEFPWEESEENILLAMLRLDLRARMEATAQGLVPSEAYGRNEGSWGAYLGSKSEIATGAASPTVYGPHLTTEWHQEGPYWDDCPPDTVCGDQSLVCCVATALSQIMNYWRYPTEVTFTADDSYPTATHGFAIDAPAASFTGLDYATGEPSDADKARLCYAAGVSVRVNYCHRVSLAYTYEVAAALAGSGPGSVPQRWGYESADVRSCNANYASWGDPYYVTEAEFYSTLSDNMIGGLPVELDIASWSGGHAIVVDGWQSEGRVYHLNFGWGSHSSGWYALPEGMPAHYTVVRYAVTNIHPPAQPPTGVCWEVFLGGAGSLARSVDVTADGGYIIAGDTPSLGGTGSDILLIKLDAAGNEMWTRSFGGAFFDCGFSVQQSSDGGYVIAGLADFDPGTPRSGDACLIKTDANGNVVWTSRFDTGYLDAGHCVRQTADGGYVVAGSTDWYPPAERGGVYLVKTDSAGGLIWERVLEGKGGACVDQTLDGGYIIAGTEGLEATGFEVYVIRTDSGGNELWARTYGGPSEDEGFSVQQSSDGGYIVVGYTVLPPIWMRDLYLLKLRPDGTLAWSRTFGGATSDWGLCVRETADGGYVATGASAIAPGGIYVVRTDDQGSKVWEGTFGSDHAGQGYSIEEIADGEYVVVGAGGGRAVAMRLGACELPQRPALSVSKGTHPNGVLISWAALPNAARYAVHRAASPNDTYVQIAEVAVSPYEDSDVTAGRVYWYKVAACNATGCSDLSAADSGYAGNATGGTPAAFRVTTSGDMRADGGLYAGNLFLGSADVAEWVLVSNAVEPGTVLELDTTDPGSYRPSQASCSSLLAGVVSTLPGITLGTSTVGPQQALLALSGIVPVKVTNEGGPIQPGDLLVSSSAPGYAMRWAGPEPCPCALVGKALESMTGDRGVISVLLTAH
jgi:hypothetical protein